MFVYLYDQDVAHNAINQEILYIKAGKTKIYIKIACAWALMLLVYGNSNQFDIASLLG